MGEKKHTHLWCPKIKSTSGKKLHFGSPTSNCTSLCMHVYHECIVVILYRCSLSVLSVVFYTIMNVFLYQNIRERKNMIMAGKWYIESARVCSHWSAWMCVSISLCTYVYSLFLLWKMLRLWNKFVLSSRWIGPMKSLN